MLKTFGSVLLVAGVVSVMSGKTYFRRVIDRAEEPGQFWVNVICLDLLGAFIWAGVLFC
jgi:hypothetical protein